MGASINESMTTLIKPDTDELSQSEFENAKCLNNFFIKQTTIVENDIKDFKRNPL